MTKLIEDPHRKPNGSKSKVPDKLVREVADLMVSALRPAHRLIEAAVQGKPVDFNSLENYLGTMLEIARKVDSDGVLISALLDDLDGWPAEPLKD